MTDSRARRAADTLMAREAAETPRRLAGQAALNEAALGRLVGALRARPPAFALTVARGSSDHAANYARYVFETRLGLVTASAAPSVVTAYGATLNLADAFVLGISQSGESPDLLAVMRQARAAGAITAALVNAEGSPLEEAAEHGLRVGAGPEVSVAATKSFLLSLTMIARLAAAWGGDGGLAAALDELPARMRDALACDWSAALPVLQTARQALVVGRGLGLPVTQEMALKLKETAALQGEPFSTAEVQHGPQVLVGDGFPVLALALADATEPGVLDLAAGLRAKGGRILLATPGGRGGVGSGDTTLPLPAPLHSVLDPVVAAQAFYPFVARLAVVRGLDPDRPRHLSKVTKTV